MFFYCNKKVVLSPIFTMGLRLCLGFTLFILLPIVLFINTRAEAAFLMDRVVAVVNQEVITWSELYRAMEMDATPQVKAMKEDERMKVFKENEATFLEMLINLRLQLQEAKNAGIATSPLEVKEAIESIKQKYKMTDAVFLESLKRENLTFEEYRRKLSDEITLGKLINQEIRNKILIKDQEIDSYLESNNQLSKGTEDFRIGQIFFKAPQSDKDRAVVEQKALLVHDKLQSGEAFEDLAMKYSEDPSGKSGGDLGFLNRKSLAKEFVDAIANLKPGEVSMPFWTDKGCHIVKLYERIKPKDQKDVREEARKILSDRAFKTRYEAWIKSLREKSYLEIRL